MRALLFLLLCSSLSPLAAGAPPTPSALAKAVDAYVAPFLPYHAFSGVILVGRGDEIVFQKAYGLANHELSVPNRVDTRFRIASISKRFTQIVVRRLADEGKLSLDDKLSRFAPGFPKAEAITVSHLVTHRSGVRDPERLRRTIAASYTPKEVVDLLAREPLGSEPGETYSYTTANYAILAHVIETVTGSSYADVLRKMVYERAGMTDAGDLTTVSVIPRLASGYMPDPYSDGGVAVSGPEDSSWKACGGSGYATARDLFRFLRALYRGKLLGALSPFELFSHDTAFGKRVFQSNGSFPGANASATYFPDDALAVVVLSNTYCTVAGPLAKDLGAIALGERYTPPVAPRRPGLPPSPLDPRLAGTYTLEGYPQPFTIATRHGRPVLSWNTVRESAFLRVSETDYFMPLDWATVSFRFGSGTVEGTWTAPWADRPLRVTRQP